MRELLLAAATPESLNWIGFLLLAAGLLGEVGVLTIPSEWHSLHKLLGFVFAAIVLVGYVIGHIADDEIAARYSNRATKAELELARIKLPRIITPHQAKDFIAKLRPYAGNKFWIIVDKSEIDVGSEQENLSRELSEIFLQAQWIKDPHTMKDRSRIDPDTTPVSNRGCVVSTADNSSSVNLAKVVLGALSSAAIECESAGPFPEMAPETVAIEIGLR